MRSSLLLALLFLAACGGAQQNTGGKVFCQSYQDNYLPECQRNCEEGLEIADQDGIAKCLVECRQDLIDDDTFADSCPDEAAKLASES